ncbi:toll/interleukin-1 receptor domain-containing protein [Klebsiella pneumoniae]|uniref:toll/interleukin-1 receptor domain-containing protein n=1 Tax=Klebsiella pneumoniae TaxID=573 RepID=UPI000B40E512|nr:toll/interleukin-1 receptor domain-containing protein [Klebsiella pneumoniae]OVU92589.1 hypothetical protein BME06_24240 [Klebsiella pneumoniae]
MKVFISYSHADVQMAQRLKNYLLRENIEVLNDKFNVSTGSNVLSSISQAIDNSDAVLFLISKNINKSEWAQQEISLAVTSKLNGRNVKLIPVLIDRHAAIPFFLKDYIYLDMTEGNDFEYSMSLLMKGLMDKQTTSIEDEQAIKIQKINIDREILRIKNIEYENYKNFKTRQMFLIALTTTLFSAFAVSIGLLGWLVKVEYSQLAWLIAFSTGVLVSMVGASLYIRKEMKNRDETIRKIKEAYDSIKNMESLNDK